MTIHNTIEISEPNFVCNGSFVLETAHGGRFFFHDGDPIGVRKLSPTRYAIGEDRSGQHAVLVVSDETFIERVLPYIGVARFELSLRETAESHFNVIQSDADSAFDKLASIPLTESPALWTNNVRYLEVAAISALKPIGD